MIFSAIMVVCGVLDELTDGNFWQGISHEVEEILEFLFLVGILGFPIFLFCFFFSSAIERLIRSVWGWVKTNSPAVVVSFVLIFGFVILGSVMKAGIDNIEHSVARDVRYGCVSESKLEFELKYLKEDLENQIRWSENATENVIKEESEKIRSLIGILL